MVASLGTPGVGAVDPLRPWKQRASFGAEGVTRGASASSMPASHPVPTAFPKAEVEIGLWSLALGRTQDPDAEHPPSMSIGIISAVNRIWGKCFQTDCKTSPVNYGGPLVALDGRVFGVVVPASNRAEGETAGVDTYDGGIGFAIAIDSAKPILQQIQDGEGSITPDTPRLGVSTVPLDTVGSAARERLGIETDEGAFVVDVTPGSGAEDAGLEQGDVIIAVDGEEITSNERLGEIIREREPGDSIEIEIERGGEEQTLTAQIGRLGG